MFQAINQVDERDVFLTCRPDGSLNVNVTKLPKYDQGTIAFHAVDLSIGASAGGVTYTQFESAIYGANTIVPVVWLASKTNGQSSVFRIVPVYSIDGINFDPIMIRDPSDATGQTLMMYMIKITTSSSTMKRFVLPPIIGYTGFVGMQASCETTDGIIRGFCNWRA